MTDSFSGLMACWVVCGFRYNSRLPVNARTSYQLNCLFVEGLPWHPKNQRACLGLPPIIPSDCFTFKQALRPSLYSSLILSCPGRRGINNSNGRKARSLDWRDALPATGDGKRELSCGCFWRQNCFISLKTTVMSMATNTANELQQSNSASLLCRNSYH